MDSNIIIYLQVAKRWQENLSSLIIPINQIPKMVIAVVAGVAKDSRRLN
jgi:hypothetical protein